jgi:hypothetical protein
MNVLCAKGLAAGLECRQNNRTIRGGRDTPPGRLVVVVNIAFVDVAAHCMPGAIVSNIAHSVIDILVSLAVRCWIT